MEYDIIELRNWFRENGKMDFELNKNLPKTEQGKTITYNCKDIDNIFESVLSNSKIECTETIEQLQTRIKELEAKCKYEYQRGIEDGKIIAEHGTTMYQE